MNPLFVATYRGRTVLATKMVALRLHIALGSVILVVLTGGCVGYETPELHVVRSECVADTIVIEMRNPGRRSLWVQGYAIDRPQYVFLHEVDGHPQLRIPGYCGTGLNMRELRGGESVRFRVPSWHTLRPPVEIGVCWYARQDDDIDEDRRIAWSDAWSPN